MIQIRFPCPTDKCVALIEYGPLEKCEGSIQCPRCKNHLPLTVTPTMRHDGQIDQCAVCGCRELFIRKDFPQRIGLLVVVVFGLAATYFFNKDVRIAWSILAAAVLVDLAIYAFIGRVTTCYACRAEYRGVEANPHHEGFDLATSEKY